jgi:F0F1-type ATP synthase assembly protein I
MSVRATRSPLVIVLVVTPLVIAPLLLFGVYLGFYVGDALGYSKAIWAIAFSTVGFIVGFFIVLKLVFVIVARTSRGQGKDTSPKVSETETVVDR